MLWVAVRLVQVGAAWNHFCVKFNIVEVLWGASEPSQTAERIVHTKLDPSVAYAKAFKGGALQNPAMFD